MSDLGWFTIFAAIFVLMVVVTGWMVWFSRRAMKSQKGQIEDIIREMRDVIDSDGQGADEDGS